MPPKKAVKQPGRPVVKPRATQTSRPSGPATTNALTADTLPAETGTPAGSTLVAPPPPRPAAAPRVAAMPPTRRMPQASAAGSSLRNLRGRVAQQLQVMDLREEMAWIRSDIAHLTVLAVIGFVLLVILAIVLPAMGL